MMMSPARSLRRGTWATPGPMSRDCAPHGDHKSASSRVELAKAAEGSLAVAHCHRRPELNVVTPVERISVKEPSTESLGVTHDVTPCFHGRGQCITPKLNRKMLFFMPQISIFRLRRSDRRLPPLIPPERGLERERCAAARKARRPRATVAAGAPGGEGGLAATGEVLQAVRR